MTMAPLRIGFAGANAQRGWAKDAHLGAISAVPDLIVQAVSARTQEIADGAKALFGAASAYDDSLALARDTQVDNVAFALPQWRQIDGNHIKPVIEVVAEVAGLDLCEGVRTGVSCAVVCSLLCTGVSSLRFVLCWPDADIDASKADLEAVIGREETSPT